MPLVPAPTCCYTALSPQVMTNAGQANAATGDQGLADAKECAATLAKALGITPDDVLLQSTGEGWGSGVAYLDLRGAGAGPGRGGTGLARAGRSQWQSCALRHVAGRCADDVRMMQRCTLTLVHEDGDLHAELLKPAPDMAIIACVQA